MKKPTLLFISATLLSACSLGSALPAAAASQAESTRYYYCEITDHANNKPSTAYFSEVFRVNEDTYTGGAQGAFYKYLSARQELSTRTTNFCLGPYVSHREAEDDLNNAAAKNRIEKYDIVFTRWRYSE